MPGLAGACAASYAPTHGGDDSLDSVLMPSTRPAPKGSKGADERIEPLVAGGPHAESCDVAAPVVSPPASPVGGGIIPRAAAWCACPPPSPPPRCRGAGWHFEYQNIEKHCYFQEVGKPSGFNAGST